MAIRRDQAFPIFEALLDAGYRPRLSGMRVTDANQDRHRRYWEPGTEGYFLSVQLETERAGITSQHMAFFDELAVAHNVKAWFQTYETLDDYGEGTGGAVVSFQALARGEKQESL
jgi:hypothetical protein